MEECKSLNEKWGKTLDYMVNCNFSSACGGPRYVKKSECVDCVTKTGINTNTAPPVTSGSNKVPVYLTYYKYTTYCPQQNVSAVQAIDADIAKLAPKAAQDANACEADFKKNDSCWQTCNSTSTADWSKCSYGSAGYQTCMDTENAKYSSCITKCTNPSDSCKWAWGEVNNLSSQINNLCK